MRPSKRRQQDRLKLTKFAHNKGRLQARQSYVNMYFPLTIINGLIKKCSTGKEKALHTAKYFKCIRKTANRLQTSINYVKIKSHYVFLACVISFLYGLAGAVMAVNTSAFSSIDWHIAYTSAVVRIPKGTSLFYQDAISLYVGRSLYAQVKKKQTKKHGKSQVNKQAFQWRENGKTDTTENIYVKTTYTSVYV